MFFFFFFQAEDGIRDLTVTGVQTCALPISIVLGDSHTRFLDRAASNTGGTVVSATRTSVTSALARLLADINSRYLVVYQSKSKSRGWRSEEHTSELQSQSNLVCRLLLEKKK